MKINCLIISDNAKNRALIISTLRRYCTPELNLSEVNTDGEEAKLSAFCPHIAILDITDHSEKTTERMNRFRRENQETYFIEFIRYRQFTFSQDITSLDHVEYLPRPIQAELLQESVTRFVNEITRKEKSISEDLQTIVNDNIPVIRQHYLSLLLRRGGYDHAVILKKFRSLQIDLSGPFYTVIVVDMPGEKDKEDYEAISFLVLSSMKSLMKSNGYQVYIFFDSDYCINSIIGHESRRQRESICDLMERFQKYCLLYMDVQLLTGVGEAVDAASDIHLSFASGMQALQQERSEALLSHSRKMTDAKSYIEENLSDPKLGLESISSYFGFSGSYFSRSFRKEQGIGFSEYLRFRRIEKAKKYLSESEMQVKEIAGRVGFSTPRYFSTSFRDVTGLSPGAYRLQIKKESK